MKYIILPILKFIWALILWITNKIVNPIFKFLWAIILTIGYTIFYIPIKLIEIIWTLKVKFRGFRFGYYDQNIYISPYWKPEVYPVGTEWAVGKIGDPINFKDYYFKSYYHYIWNIK